MRVLIADDSTLIRESLKEMLALEEGVEVVGEAADGERAAKLVDELRPDVMTLDLRMPGRTGIEVLLGLQRRPDRPIIVVLTSYRDAVVRKACTELGADFFLVKGADDEELRSVLAECRSRILRDRAGGETDPAHQR